MSEVPVRESWEDIIDDDFDRSFEDGLRNDRNGFANDDRDYFNNETTEVTTKMLYNPKGKTIVSNMDAATKLKILQRPIVHEDDQNRTAYVPQVKILKRPGKVGNSSKIKTDANKQAPMKTLAEREVAYAEARKRIMGDANKSKNLNSSDTRPDHLRRNRNSKTKLNGANVERLPKGPDGEKGFGSNR